MSARQTLDQAVTEKAFMATVVEMAQRLGWLTYHTHDSRHSAAGYPDLTMLRRDRVVVAELKTEKGVVSPAQRTCLDAFINAGVDTFVWRPCDMDEIEAVLRG